MRALLMTSAIVMAISGSAIAAGAEKTGAIELKDGSTVHIYKDGKMAMENKVGKTVTMEAGHPMETKDGQVIMMKGNEVWRLWKGEGDSTLRAGQERH